MWASLTYILLLAPAFIPSAVAQCSINLSAIADAVLFFDPANTTEFTYTFDFSMSLFFFPHSHILIGLP